MTAGFLRWFGLDAALVAAPLPAGTSGEARLRADGAGVAGAVAFVYRWPDRRELSAPVVGLTAL